MIAHKHISKIIIAITAVAVILCIASTAFADELTDILGGTAVRMEYETELFDTSEVIQLNIIMDDEQWDSMLENAMTEEYYVCDVVVNGTRVNNVAIRPKGNTSLSAIAMDPETDRFSLKLEFDHFVDGQTCFGLDKLILNNNYADATNMKEAVIYDMYQYLGADASLYNYAKVSVNGEYWGVYLALEGVEQSFMLRNFGTQDGELYKPDTMEMGGNSSSGGGMGGFSMGGGGANLNYTDDDLDSYQTIWDSEVTGTSKNDHRRVVTALKNISEGNDLETYLDVENVLKYMAVHTFAVNLDSLSGSMSHNYYLYEYNGQLNIFPWDYNLSFGGFSMGTAGDGTSVINDAVDTPFSGTKFFNALLENEEYLTRYHEYLQMLTDEYVEGGRFDTVYNRIRNQIDTLVAEDPTAFYSAEDYEVAVEVFYNLINLRAESISGQIAGTIPSTDAGQKTDSSSLIDGSDIDVSLMGEFSMGGGMGGGFGFKNRGGNVQPDKDTPETSVTTETSESGTEQSQPAGGQNQPGQGMPSGDFDPNNMPSDFDPNSMPSGDFGNMPSGDFDPNNMPNMGDFDFSNMPSDFDPNSMPNMGDFDPANIGDFDPASMGDFDFSNMPGGFTPGGNTDGNTGSNSGMPSFPGSGTTGGAFDMSKIANVASLIGCFILMIVALVILKFIKPKG